MLFIGRFPPQGDLLYGFANVIRATLREIEIKKWKKKHFYMSASV